MDKPTEVQIITDPDEEEFDLDGIPMDFDTWAEWRHEQRVAAQIRQDNDVRRAGREYLSGR